MQTIYIILMTIGLYSGITTKTVHGAIGTVTFVGICTFVLELELKRIAGFELKKVLGICLIVCAIIFDVMAVLIPEIALSRIGLSIISGVIAIIYCIAILGYAKTFIGKVSGLVMVIGLFMAALFCWQNMGAFSPDSYSYYEISQTFMNEFGRVNTIRQYVLPTDYNISFPYFYPLCLFVVDGVTGLGRYAGVLFNIYIMLFTALLFIKISKKFAKRMWCGAVAAFLLFATESYLGEICAARAIPLAIFVTVVCIALCVELYLSQRNSKGIPFFIGICAGTVMTIRFDGMVLVAYCLLIIFCVQKERRWKNIFYYLVGTFIMLLPWILYSWNHFQTLWISDNLGTMFLVEATVPNRVNVPGEFTATIFNSFQEWLRALVYKAYAIGKSFFTCSRTADVILMVCLITLIGKCITRKVAITKEWLLPLAIITYYVGKTVMYVLVGYNDIRYHVETVVLLAFLLLMLCEHIGEGKQNKGVLAGLTVIVIGVMLFYSRGILKKLYLEPNVQPLKNIEVAYEWVTKLDGELKSVINRGDAEILFLGDGFDFGGWTDWKVYVAPDKPTWTKVEYAMEQYMDVDYVVLPKEYWIPDGIYENLQKKYKKIELSEFWLFEI